MEGVFAVQAIMSLVDSITGPLRGVDRQLDATEGRALRLGQRMGQLAKSMLPIAAVAGMLLLGFGGATATAADFEAAVSSLGAISRASAVDLDSMRQSALDLAASTAFTGSQVVNAQTELAKKGFDANQIIAAMPGLLDLAAATQSDVAVAASVASGALNAFNLEASRTNEVADIIAAASTSSATDIDGLSMALQNAGAVVAGVGEDFALLAAITGKLADANINAAVGSTATKIMFNRLSAPMGDAAKALNSLGIQTRDAQGNMLPFVGIMGNLEQALEGMGTAARAEYIKRIFGEEAVGSVTALLNQGIIRAFGKQDLQGGASEMARKQLDNLRGSITILGSGWEALNITVGSVFTPILKLVVDGASWALSILTKLAQTPIGETIILVAGALAVGVVAITAFAAASWAASAVLPLLGGALAAVSWPIWLIVAAVGVLALAWQTNFGGMADTLSGWWKILQLVYQGVVAVFASLKDGVGIISGQLAQDIDAAGLVGVVTTVARIAYRVREFWLGMTEAISTAWDTAVTNISPVLSALGDSFGWLAELVGMAVSVLFGASAATDASSWRLLGEVVGTLLGSAFQTFATAIRIATIPLRMVGGLLGFIVDLANGMDLAEAGSKLLTTFWEGIKSEAGALYENFKTLLGPLGRMLPHSDAKEGPLSTLTASGAAIPDTLGEGVRSAAPRLAATMAGAFDGLAIAGAAPAPALAEAPAAPEIRVQAPAPARSSQQMARQIIIQRLEVKLDGVKDADGFLAQLARFVEAHDG